jgi:hypothetical protein
MASIQTPSSDMAGEGRYPGGLAAAFTLLSGWRGNRQEQMHVRAISSPEYGGTVINKTPWRLEPRWKAMYCTVQALSVFSYTTFYCTFVHQRICPEHSLL